MGCGIAATSQHIVPAVKLVKSSISVFFLLWLFVSQLLNAIIQLVFGG
jgi:hypothetical protein